MTNSMVDYMLEVFFIVVKYTKHKILCVYFSVIKCIHTVIEAQHQIASRIHLDSKEKLPKAFDTLRASSYIGHILTSYLIKR